MCVASHTMLGRKYQELSVMNSWASESVAKRSIPDELENLTHQPLPSSSFIVWSKQMTQVMWLSLFMFNSVRWWKANRSIGISPPIPNDANNNIYHHRLGEPWLTGDRGRVAPSSERSKTKGIPLLPLRLSALALLALLALLGHLRMLGVRRWANLLVISVVSADQPAKVRDNRRWILGT